MGCQYISKLLINGLLTNRWKNIKELLLVVLVLGWPIALGVAVGAAVYIGLDPATFWERLAALVVGGLAGIFTALVGYIIIVIFVHD